MLTRRQFLAGGVIAGAGLGLYSGEIARHELSVESRTVNIRNLPAAFHGFRIAQLSDIHFRKYDEPFFVRRAVERINELKPDLVAVTGDFITNNNQHAPDDEFRANVRDVEECAGILDGIQCPVRFSSLGNHDVPSSRGILPVLTRHNLHPLNNAYEALDLRGDRLWIAGVADAYMSLPNLPEALPERTPHQPILLLGHEPDFADEVANAGKVDLMLTGHTHGGQVRLPWTPPLLLPAMGTRYVEGLFNLRGGLQLYVNRGLGCMHLPFRLNCPPEVTLLTLQPAAEAS